MGHSIWVRFSRSLGLRWGGGLHGTSFQASHNCDIFCPIHWILVSHISGNKDTKKGRNNPWFFTTHWFFDFSNLDALIKNFFKTFLSVFVLPLSLTHPDSNDLFEAKIKVMFPSSLPWYLFKGIWLSFILESDAVPLTFLFTKITTVPFIKE